ncbi:hypothetical protein HXX76_005465 [Chlamydomonas incerta]|uniref:EGF-like domain-containing protein n=1 Tax=Chlamydomonas incerta TaxID=51695 RepID=A0A835W275_CHLIN|nr:hypothetical protein HXX76_005465 [Chlamydomonas incerta]|eukprot:KAG2437847.1 hypothetical protein HXX76_005465 [Chlamydomonas incerta]
MRAACFRLLGLGLLLGHAYASWLPWTGEQDLAATSSRRTLLQIGFQVPQISIELPPRQFLNGSNSGAGSNRTDHSDLAGGGGGEARRDESDLRRRCAVVRGSWCGAYLRQELVPYRAAPRGDKECPGGCSGWGNCNHDWGLCECPAGRTGPACEREVKRPCTNRFRHPHEVNVNESVGHIGPDKHDLDVKAPGWIASRCSGYCIDHLALCTCGRDSKYRHIPAPEGSPPWTPPVQWGRPMTDGCMIGVDKDGSRIDWGRPHIKDSDMYGPDGWCNKDPNPIQCGCVWDGNGWPCDGSQQYEPFCPNQCTGHGDCHMGWCRCHPGWYGMDCSRKKAGLELDEGYLQRPWIKRVVEVPPASLRVRPLPTRPRPLIYIYDLTDYTTKFLQLRLGADACMWRRFGQDNSTFLLSMTYSVEAYLHETLLQSEHRTFDPEEADFFYVPVYVTCYMWPILGWADGPWWYAPLAHTRTMHVSNMLTEVHAHISSTYPWWNRRGGRDHIWLMTPDEGACYMPSVIFNTSIILTHWGRMDQDHKSNTGYLQDNYDMVMPEEFKGWPGMDWQSRSRGHPCYDPTKDLVIPAFKSVDHFRDSPLLGGTPLVRDLLCYFRGDIGQARFPQYSRGLRQKLFHLWHKNGWAAKHKVYFGNGEMVRGGYSEHLLRSRFCLVLPGDGWSPRAEDAVLHGCIPVVIMDNVHAVFESILDWESFSIRIREDDAALEALPQLLEAVPPERVAKMQRNLARVWHRFAYATGPVMAAHLKRIAAGAPAAVPASEAALAAASLTARDTPFRPLPAYPVADDAFHTILQWLYHRINETRA